MAKNLTQPVGATGPGPSKSKTASTKPDKSGFGGGTVDPGLVTPFKDAIFKK